MSTIEEGVYRIRSVANGQLVTYDSLGHQAHGRLRARNEDKIDNSVVSQQQRWLIALVPNSNDCYNIINLYYGVLAGVYIRERKKADPEKVVSAAPCAMISENAIWYLNKAGENTYTIRWREDDSHQRVLHLKGTGSDGDIITLPPLQTPNQQWALERDEKLDRLDRGFVKWMSYVPEEYELTRLSIPCTHQSLSIVRGLENTLKDYARTNAKCQDRSVYEQLVDGVRMLDLRFGCWTGVEEPNCLYAHHGSYIGPVYAGITEYVCLAAVLQQIKVFLGRFPSETVVVKVANETATENFLDGFLEDFEPLLRSQPELFYTAGDSWFRLSEVLLKEARGKIIIFRPDRDNWNELPDEHLLDGKQYWSAEDHFYDGFTDDTVEWDWCMTPNVAPCEVNVSQAMDDPKGSHGYSQVWAGSTILPGGDPWHCMQQMKEDIDDVYDPAVIGIDGSKPRVGMVMFDFYHEVAVNIANIIRSNKGCGSLRQ